MRSGCVLIILVLCFLFTGCATQAVAADPTQTATDPVQSSTHPLSSITLGISPDQLLAQIQVEIPDYTESPLPEDLPDAPKDGRIYNMTDYSFFFQAKGLELFFTFSSENTLVTISNWDSSLPTPEGLTIGSKLETAKGIYGDNYILNPEDLSVLQYQISDSFLNIFYEADIVTGWSLSKYPNINND